jgi:hypothetical protein
VGVSVRKRETIADWVSTAGSSLRRVTKMRPTFVLPAWAIVSLLLATGVPDFSRLRAEDFAATANKNACSGSGATIFVQYEIWAECLSFLVLGEAEGAQAAILFVGGDIPDDRQIPTNQMLHTFAKHRGFRCLKWPT